VVVPTSEDGSHRIVAVVPARGGSKRLARKNLRLLGGVPLLVHTVRAALAARRVDRLYVSTEDREIARAAAAAGAGVIDRPAELAADTVKGDAVLRHALELLQLAGQAPEIAVLLQPTSPLRRAADIDACVQLFEDQDAGSVFSVCAVDHHPGKAVLVHDGHVEPFTTERDMEARRQDMVDAYRQNGAVYVVGVADFLASGRLYRRPCRAHVMDRRDSIDIDDELDLRLAEMLLAVREAAA
jgi:CMP-N-acetylneuraminic acid synthetase